MSRTLKILLKVTVSAILISWFLFRNDNSQIVSSLSNVSIFVFIIAVFITIVAIYSNSIKWQLLLPQYRIRELFRTNLIGQYYSLLLPGQIAGEVAKAFHLSRNESGTGEIAASITIDKITGLVGAVFVVGIFGLLMTAMPISKMIIGVLVALAVAAVAALYVARIIWQRFTFKTKIIFASILFGVAYQLFSVVVTMLIARDVGIMVSFYDWCWMLSLLSIALLLPITLGGLGLREATLVGLLALFSVPSEKALALSFVLFGIQIAVSALGGIAIFFKHNQSNPQKI